MSKNFIQQIRRSTDKKLVHMARLIWPIKDFSPENGTAGILNPRDIEGQAFGWDPEIVAIAKDLTPEAEVKTYHTYGFHGFFKPSAAEVLVQIKETVSELAKKNVTIVAYSMPSHDGSRTIIDGVSVQQAWVTLYSGTLPEKELSAFPIECRGKRYNQQHKVLQTFETT